MASKPCHAPKTATPIMAAARKDVNVGIEIIHVMDEKGDKASSTSVHTFKPHTDTQYFTATALNFDNKCYLQVDDIDTPYHFDILDMTVIEMRFYVDDELIGTDQTAPYSYQGFIPALSNDEHTLKAVYDVKDKTGGKASCIITDTFNEICTSESYLVAGEESEILLGRLNHEIFFFNIDFI